MSKRSTQLASLLRDIRQGSSDAEHLLIEIVYAELKRLASRRMKSERENHTLQTTAVVHEAYLRLSGGGLRNVTDLHHFFALAARQMRSVLVDHARARDAAKRGDGLVRVELQEAHKALPAGGMDVIGLDAALNRLQQEHERAAQVVELKFFGGYTDEEIAQILDIAHITVRRDWAFARAWLLRELRSPFGDGPSALAKTPIA